MELSPGALAPSSQAEPPYTVAAPTEPVWLPTALLAEDTGGKVGACQALWCVPNSPYESLEGALAAIRYARALFDVAVHTPRYKRESAAAANRALGLLKFVGLEAFAAEEARNLPYGKQRLLEIARALALDPQLLLLDEPAAGLDLGGREDLLRRLTSLARDPKAPMMVLVTHHVEEVPDGFTHAMLLRRGSVLAAGPIEDVFTARNLSRCFGVQLEIEHRQSRWTARAR